MIVVTGLGKSGFVAQKLAATMCSTGTPAVFLHPVDALHGDVGIYAAGDPTIILSKSGTTLELLRLIPVLRGLNSPLIGIVGNQRVAIGARDGYSARCIGAGGSGSLQPCADSEYGGGDGDRETLWRWP